MQGFEGFLLGEVKCQGAVSYEYIFGLFQNQKPLFYVTAEKRSGSDQLFLGVFDEIGHINRGVHQECSDQVSFLVKAFELVAERFMIDIGAIKEIPKAK